MMRRVLAILALAVLLVPAAQAASPGARDPIAADGTVSDVAIAATSGRFAATNDDARSGFIGPRDHPVWNLWNLDGSLRAAGPADRETCTSADPATTEPCDSDARLVAVNAAGTRIAVVSRASSGNDILTTFTETGGRVMIVEIPNTQADIRGDITSLAMDAPGNYVAVGLSVSNTGSATTGRILLYPFTSKDPIINHPTTGAITDIDLESGLLVASGGGHYRFKAPGDTPYPNTAVSGSAVAVDASTHPLRWSIAGYSTGFFALYSDGLGDEQPSIPEYQKREAGDTTALNAVAIRNDATAFVTGNSAGVLRLYSLDPSSQSPDTVVSLAASVTGLGSIQETAFSNDGRYLAVRAGNTIRLYSTTNSALTEMFSDTRSGALGTVAIDARGEHVVAAVGSNVLVYDAIHRLTASAPSASQQPGTNTTYNVPYRNDGNRVEAVSLSATPPAGATVDVSPSEFTLNPGQSRTVQVTVRLPAGQSPGSLPIPLGYRLANGLDGTGTHTLAITVPTVRQVLLESDGAASRGANLGGPAVFDVLVRNAGNVQETVDLEVANLPAGWNAALSTTGVILVPGAVENLTVSVQPPAGTADGVSATVDLRRSGGGATPLRLTATVGANFGVELQVPAGLSIEAGAGRTFQVTVKNSGNALDSITVKVNQLPPGWVGGFQNGLESIEVVGVEPGQSRIVEASLRPPVGSESSVPSQVTLTASSEGDPGKAQTKGILVTVEGADETSSSSTTGGGGGNGIPGPTPVLLLLALALGALAVRRKAGK